MNVILFGATGMVGQGVLRECLRDASITRVLVVGRNPLGVTDPKLREILHGDLMNLAPIESELAGYDACFYCLGITSAGMKEADYRHITVDYTVSVAGTLARLNPQMTFIFVSGANSDSSEKSRTMWARVKGAAENAVRAMPFKASYIFRPAFIQPLGGIKSKTKMYNRIYAIVEPLVPVLRAIAPSMVTTTEHVGRAMIEVAKNGAPKYVLENADIHALGTPKSA